MPLSPSPCCHFAITLIIDIFQRYFHYYYYAMPLHYYAFADYYAIGFSLPPAAAAFSISLMPPLIFAISIPRRHFRHAIFRFRCFAAIDAISLHFRLFSLIIDAAFFISSFHFLSRFHAIITPCHAVSLCQRAFIDSYFCRHFAISPCRHCYADSCHDSCLRRRRLLMPAAAIDTPLMFHLPFDAADIDSYYAIIRRRRCRHAAAITLAIIAFTFSLLFRFRFGD